MGIHTNV